MVLVDSNILLDVLTADPLWGDRSALAMEKRANGGMAINPIIFAEISCGFSSASQLEALLEPERFIRLSLPYEAAFLAGKAFWNYRRRGGAKRSPLPDFYIGAHAQVSNLSLLTRDVARYRTYFPNLKILTP